MCAKRAVLIRPFVEDIRVGLTDLELMEKYGVSQAELRFLFKKLASRGVVRPDEHPALRPDQFEDTIELDL